MVDHICQNLTGIFLIVSHLGAAVWMLECDHVLYITSHKFLSSRFQGLCNGVHTAYGRNDPDFIADSCLPVGSAVAFKICVLCGFYILMAFRLIIISKNISKSRLHIMNVNPLSRLDIFLGKTDAEAVLYNLFSALYFPQRKLVALGDIFHKGHCGFCRLQYLSLI